MSWVRIEDTLPDHPKFWMLDSCRDAALSLYVFALCWCSRNLTDGEVPKRVMHAQNRRGKMICEKMVEVGLLEDKGRSYMVHDYLDYNTSASKVKAARARHAEAQRRYADRLADSSVTPSVIVPQTQTHKEIKTYAHSSTNEQVSSGKKIKPKPARKEEPYPPAFLEFWEAYPRKVEKKRCLSVWSARLREGVDPTDMINAAKAYASDVKKHGTEEQFVKHPSTFIGPSLIFEEWANRPVPKPERPRVPCQVCEGQGFTMVPGDEEEWEAVPCSQCDGGWVYGELSA